MAYVEKRELLSPEEKELARACADRLRRRAARAQEARRERRERGRKRARGLARLLGEAGARGVWLIGSMAGEAGPVHEGSDLDIVVEGLSREAFRRAASEAEERADLPLDILRMEDLSAGFRASIREHGEELHVPGR